MRLKSARLKGCASGSAPAARRIAVRVVRRGPLRALLAVGFFMCVMDSFNSNPRIIWYGIPVVQSNFQRLRKGPNLETRFQSYCRKTRDGLPKKCPALKRIVNWRAFSGALKRSSPRINSGAATVTPQLRRDECGVPLLDSVPF
jgi:hypothetical protein